MPAADSLLRRFISSRVLKYTAVSSLAGTTALTFLAVAHPLFLPPLVKNLCESYQKHVDPSCHLSFSTIRGGMLFNRSLVITGLSIEHRTRGVSLYFDRLEIFTGGWNSHWMLNRVFPVTEVRISGLKGILPVTQLKETKDALRRKVYQNTRSWARRWLFPADSIEMIEGGERNLTEEEGNDKKRGFRNWRPVRAVERKYRNVFHRTRGDTKIVDREDEGAGYPHWLDINCWSFGKIPKMSLTLLEMKDVDLRLNFFVNESLADFKDERPPRQMLKHVPIHVVVNSYTSGEGGFRTGPLIFDYLLNGTFQGQVNNSMAFEGKNSRIDDTTLPIVASTTRKKTILPNHVTSKRIENVPIRVLNMFIPFELNKYKLEGNVDLECIGTRTVEETAPLGIRLQKSDTDPAAELPKIDTESPDGHSQKPTGTCIKSEWQFLFTFKDLQLVGSESKSKEPVENRAGPRILNQPAFDLSPDHVPTTEETHYGSSNRTDGSDLALFHPKTFASTTHSSTASQSDRISSFLHRVITKFNANTANRPPIIIPVQFSVETPVAITPSTLDKLPRGIRSEISRSLVDEILGKERRAIRRELAKQFGPAIRRGLWMYWREGGKEVSERTRSHR